MAWSGRTTSEKGRRECWSVATAGDEMGMPKEEEEDEAISRTMSGARWNKCAMCTCHLHMQASESRTCTQAHVANTRNTFDVRRLTRTQTCLCQTTHTHTQQPYQAANMAMEDKGTQGKLSHVLLFNQGGGGRTKIPGTGVQLFLRGVPPEGQGGTKKKFARRFFPDPKT